MIAYGPELSSSLKQPHAIAPVVLVDVQLVDGVTNFYWSTADVRHTSKLDLSSQLYKSWVKRAGPFRLFKSLRTDAGSLTIQNLSGNTIDREVGLLIRNNQFDGALTIVRYLDLLSMQVVREFHGTLSNPTPTPVEVGFRVLQLMDLSQYDGPAYDYAPDCPLRYKGKGCDSASGLTTCPKTFAACDTRGVKERFMGLTTPPPVMPNIVRREPSGGHSGSGDSGPRTGGGGRMLNVL
jgi:hypothetical protein